MGQITIDTKRPAPKLWRKFENMYIMFIAPAMGTAIQGWGFSDAICNKSMIVIGVSVALVKGVGFFLANGEEYTSTQNFNLPEKP
jgi:hypothetical protein